MNYIYGKKQKQIELPTLETEGSEELVVVIVTGTRDMTVVEAPILYGKLSALKPDLVVEGGATGTDKFARMWCVKNLVPICTVFAAWQRYGRAAGPRRNGKMIQMFPQAIIAGFPSPTSVGTWDCINQGKKAGLKVHVTSIGLTNDKHSK